MTDRELLEFAAKAAGIELRPMVIKPVPPGDGDGFIGYLARVDQWPRGWFDPLNDDGDALRLAAVCGIDIEFHRDFPGCYGAFSRARWCNDEEAFGECDETYNNDPYAATRRAIVRAAASIAEAA